MALAGGVIGVIAGICVAKTITLIIEFPSTVELWSILVSLFVATAVGLFFGVYPAYKARNSIPSLPFDRSYKSRWRVTDERFQFLSRKWVAVLSSWLPEQERTGFDSRLPSAT